MIEGVRIAGKTGTTNNYRDAWFVGYTGNLVAGVWVGNDDYSSSNRMTGGSLPAMIWKSAMSYAHQGIELKPLPGIPPAATPATRTPVASAAKGATPVPLRPTVLTRRGTDVLVRIEHLMEDASRALPAPSGEVSELPAGHEDAGSREAFASATGNTARGTVRGN
jgi:penicillin-binding protein 1A